MQTKAYHTLRNTPLSQLRDVPPLELLAYAQALPPRTRLTLLALLLLRG
jgi:hypothetical protein